LYYNSVILSPPLRSSLLYRYRAPRALHSFPTRRSSDLLGSSLSEIYPTLQVLFFPNYPATERRLEIAETKVFPEPIEGDDLLSAIERAENAPPDAPDLFHVVDVLQMCCLSRRNGALQLVKESKSGLAFLRNS